MSTKNILVIVIFIAAVTAVIVWGFGMQKQGPASSGLQLAPNEAALSLDYGSGRKRMFVGEVIGGMTILDAVLQSAAAGNINVETRPGDDNTVWVEKVDGAGPDAGKSWNIYRNGQELDGLISTEEIRPGDKVELKYE